MAYISVSDLTDVIVSGISLSAIVARSTTAVQSKAREYGVASTQINESPVDETIRQWAIAWCMENILRENAFVNNLTAPESDKYYMKYKIYKDRLDEYSKKLNKEMFLGYVLNSQINVMPMVGTMLRG